MFPQSNIQLIDVNDADVTTILIIGSTELSHGSLLIFLVTIVESKYEQTAIAKLTTVVYESKDDLDGCSSRQLQPHAVLV